TSQPSLAARLYEEGKQRGIRVMDAPVSGGDSGARNATLSIMAGGDEADFEEVKPLFDCMGKNIVYLGPAGFGQHTKAANQIALAGATAAMTEALVYARRVGLDPHKMLAAIGAGAAGSWQLNNMAPRVLNGDLAPGFYIKHYIKDMKIIREEIEQRGVELQMLNTVLDLYEQMAARGLENDGTQALIKLYEQK
ncbi:MAG: NAD(P)-dependent oxidoreductase, partial [Anaerolineaceae bacterium]